MARAPSAREELSALFRLSWPIALAQLGFMAMGLVDTAVLGHVSVTELAGSSIGRNVLFAASTPAMGVSLALEPLASQAVGAGEEARAWASLQATLRAAVLSGVPLVLAGLASLFLLERCGVDAAVASRARAYAGAQAVGVLLTLGFLAHKTFLQAHGVTRPALVASGVANLVNLVLCNLLVRGDDVLVALGLVPIGLPRLGATGAGIAFTIAAAVMLTIVSRASRMRRPRDPPGAVSVLRVARIGLPAGFQLFAEVAVFAACSVLVGRFGAVAASAHQVALGLASFSFMGALGVSGGTAVRVGYAIGEERSPRRAGLIGIACGALFMATCGTVFALVPRPLVGLFTDDAGVVVLGSSLMFIVAFFQLFDGLQVVAAGALRGAGDVRYPFVAAVAAYWGVGFPIAVTLGFGTELHVRGIWWGLAAGLITVSGLLVTRFLFLSGRPISRV